MFFTRPADEKELQKREAIGTIRAARFVRKFAESHKPIDLNVVYAIHREILKDAWPEVAGVLRTEEARITDSPYLPPHHSQIPGLMLELDKELKEQIAGLERIPVMHRFGVNLGEKEEKMITKVVHIVAWIHHKLVYIHPFVDGNGRTSRLMANLFLERFRLIGISIKVERENKNRYRAALRQIDQHGDYEPLEEIIVEGLIDRYSGITQKII